MSAEPLRHPAFRFRPRKRYGQHFLEAAWADKVVDAIAPDTADDFVEIGPGPGALTRRLAPRVHELTGIEVDRDLAQRLSAELPANARILVADVLDADLAPFVSGGRLRVAGNLPYNISSPILFKLLDAADRYPALVDATLMLQEEVADRLLARVGTAEYGVLTIFTELHADVSRLLALPPGAFRPMPKVHSSLVRLAFHPARVPIAERVQFDRLVRSIFTQRRKTLANALRPFAESLGRDARSALSAAGIDPMRRPETLSLEDAARLANVFGS